jgi:hypothetical protein
MDSNPRTPSQGLQAKDSNPRTPAICTSDPSALRSMCVNHLTPSRSPVHSAPSVPRAARKRFHRDPPHQAPPHQAPPHQAPPHQAPPQQAPPVDKRHPSIPNAPRNRSFLRLASQVPSGCAAAMPAAQAPSPLVLSPSTSFRRSTCSAKLLAAGSSCNIAGPASVMVSSAPWQTVVW